jgi:hypothetical protein
MTVVLNEAKLAFQLEHDLSAIGRAWIEWSERWGVDELDHTEALRFFGYLVVERPELLNFSIDEKTQWQVVRGYLEYASSTSRIGASRPKQR